MSSGVVTFSNAIRCPRCGFVSSGYLTVVSADTGQGTCGRCGSTVIQKLDPGYVPQVSPQPYHVHTSHGPRASRHPGLYSQPRLEPRIDLHSLVTLPFRPGEALRALYTSTDLKCAMSVVLVFAAIHAAIGALITIEMSDAIGAGQMGALEVVALAALGCVVSIVSFLVFSLASSVAGAELFGGRGNKGATVTLLAYCYPWFVGVSLALLLIFSIGFGDLELRLVEEWTESEIEHAIVWGAVILTAAAGSVVWLLFIAGKAIGVANDISTAEGALSAVVGGIAAGVVSIVIGAVVRLPLGLTL
ncbi:MAG: hypothetical protein JSV90_02235 [Methanobacteriota archaeon]|nr:MAG: hypothetical protein JSV90_02235 [Euryarchaeota archaeon]